jgi:hypothetical protein
MKDLFNPRRQRPTTQAVLETYSRLGLTPPRLTPEEATDLRDRVGVAFEYLTAIPRTASPTARTYAAGEFIGAWASCAIPSEAVEIAAAILGLKGFYPNYNVTGKPYLPSLARLDGIGCVGETGSSFGEGFTIHHRHSRLELLEDGESVGLSARMTSVLALDILSAQTPYYKRPQRAGVFQDSCHCFLIFYAAFTSALTGFPGFKDTSLMCCQFLTSPDHRRGFLCLAFS